MRKSFWFMSAGLMALAQPAIAQETPQDDSGPGPEQQAAAGTDESEVAPQDIIVTANRRASPLSDVPIAVSAITAETLQNTGANDIRQLNQVAPSLLVSSTGSEANGSARIRGIGTVGDNPGLESSVAVFIDGVYRSRSGIGLNELGEIERVEVLRGPQGTLFGRNASAGLIHIISKQPSFTTAATAELTYGNYDFLRASAGITGPIIDDVLAYRVDGVYVQRDGFYRDINNDTDVNDRDRYFVRGQLRYEPTDALSFRLIADYTKRDEKCCGATYVTNQVNPLIGNLNNPVSPILQPGAVPPRVNDAGNNIINVLRDLGQDLGAFNQAYDRTIYVTPGRSYAGETEDKGISLEANWELGAATLTSITAYRDYQSDQGSDTDYSTVDILYRAPDGGASREFQTFSQELRLQGTLFGDRLDWLVGAYYADEDLTATDNLRFGNQYGRFATCRLISGGGLAALYNPAAPGCLAARPPAFGAASPLIFAAIDRLDGINNRGSTLDRYFQNSRNYAFFTHNIFHVTDTVDLTFGLRYTNERKKFKATFGNDNTACPLNQAALGNFINPASPAFNAALFGVSNSIIGLSCQGNSTSELNGVSISDRRSEDEFTGTGVLSWKPNEDLLLYASYSRGYKAGGFNLDRSALKAPNVSFASQGGAQALVGNLQFDPEINTAYELGLKYSSRPFTISVAAFRQEFKNFQLNTFNGTVFLVQTINGCSLDLNGADRDQSIAPGSPNFVNPAIVAGSNFNFNPAGLTGACPSDNVGFGVRSQGVEVEASLRPARDLSVNLGITASDTKYRNNLVGSDTGVPLDPALRQLPGNNLSNAPEVVVTGSVAWTPDIGSSGLSGLFYIDTRVTGDYNTGSDLFPQKQQDSYAVVNARIGLRGPEERWALEFWAQNLLNEDYAQVAFNSPFQQGGTGVPPFAPGFSSAPFADPQFPGGRQIFSQFLAEPRTYGVTVRTRF
ncbi:MAG TPA: TonB-dependent receptor [Allosphingosinicella sp.]|jgi:outer membrane receptor protein involved in Fe transport|uniref:TonB-dependent receptor n=1 Tax=Allosphingosinicella sp. TaxID=2823234 RepID=UPI002F290E40